MEKLLTVLNKIEERLARLENKEKTNNEVDDSLEEEKSPESVEVVERTANETTRADRAGIIAVSNHASEEYSPSSRQIYTNAKFARFEDLITSSPHKEQNQNHGSEMHQLWTEFFASLWMLPPDGRVHLSFQKHIMDLIPENQMKIKLEYIRSGFESIGTHNFKIMDYDHDGHAIAYMPRSKFWSNQIASRMAMPLEENLSSYEEHQRIVWNFSDGSRASTSTDPKTNSTGSWRRLM